jgi:hypothetical protein
MIRVQRRRRDLLGLAAACICALLTSIAGSAVAADKNENKISAFGQYEGYSTVTYPQYTRSSIYVPVRDGTKIALDIYRPTVNGKPVSGRLPAVFEFTRYWRAKHLPDGRIRTPYFGYLAPGQSVAALPTAPNWAVNLVQHGYVLVVGDNRGTGSSFGKNPGVLTRTEATDTHDLIEWIAAQPWSTGKVGMVGTSYTGSNQITGLTEPAPHLVAIFPAVANFELYKIAVNAGVFRKGGILSMYNTLVALGTAKQEDAPLPPPVDADPKNEMRDKARSEQGEGSFSGYTAFLNSPALDHVAAELGLNSVQDRIRVLASNSALIPEIASRPDLQRELMKSGYYRNETDSFDFSAPGGEKSISPASSFDRINRPNVPAYIWSGWRDLYPGDAFLFFANITSPRKLTVGPWAHYPDNKRGDLREEEAIRLRAIETLRWFDYWLKGIDNGIMKEPRINYAVVESRYKWDWQSTNDWPLHQAQSRAMYFQDGRADSVRSENDGLLSDMAPTVAEASDSFYVDYTATTGTKTRFHDTTGGGPLFYPDLAENDAKGLTYTTAPLKQDLVVAGHPIVTLFATSTAPDGEFDAYLEDVDQFGFSTFLADGYMRALNRTTGKPFYDNLGLPWPTDARTDAEGLPALSAGIAKIEFDLSPIGARFKAGHRLRLTIQGADADSTLTFPVVPPPKVTIERNPLYPSRITLPVLPQ